MGDSVDDKLWYTFSINIDKKIKKGVGLEIWDLVYNQIADSIASKIDDQVYFPIREQLR